MKQMKQMLYEATCSADLGALVSRFLARDDPSGGDGTTSAYAHVQGGLPAQGQVLGVEREGGDRGGHGRGEGGGTARQEEWIAAWNVALDL